jgi:TolB-like protein
MNCKAENACEIIIPKGGYTPVFKKFRSSHAPPLQSGNKNSSDPDETIKIAVMPFKSWERVQLKLSVIDSVGQMLSNEFSKSPYFSVLSHYTTRQLQSENASIHDMHSRYGIQIAVTGSILINPKRITVFLQLVKAETAMLVWSDRLDMDIALSRNPNVIQLIANEIMRTIPPLSNFLVRQGSGKVARLKILPVSKIYTDNTA